MAISVGEVQATLSLKDQWTPVLAQAQAAAARFSTDAQAAIRSVGGANDETGSKATTMADAMAAAFQKVTSSTFETQKSATELHTAVLDAFKDPLSAVEQFGKAISSNVLEVLGPVGIAAGVASAAILGLGTALVDVTERAAKIGATVSDMTLKTGMSAAAVSTLSHAAEIAGGSMDQVSTALFMFQQKSETSSATVEKGLARIGLSFDAIKQASPDQQLTLIAHALSQISDPASRNAAAMELFGRSARDLMPLLLDLDAAMSKTAGLDVFSDEDAARAKDYEMDVRAITAQINDLWTSLGKDLLPMLHDVVAFAQDHKGVIPALFSPITNSLDDLRTAYALMKSIAGLGPKATPPTPGAPAAFAPETGIDDRAKEMMAVTIAAADLDAHLAHLRDTIVPLNDVQQKQAAIMLDAGDKTATVAHYLGVAVPVVDSFKKSLDVSRTSGEQFTNALTDLIPVLTSPAWDGSIDSMLKLGGSVHDTAVYFGESEGVIKSHADAMKTWNTIVGIESTKSVQDLTSALQKMGQAVPQKFFDDAGKASDELHKIESGAELAQGQLAKMGPAAKPSLDDLNATFGTIGLNFGELEKVSQSGLQHTADIAKATYEFMDAHHEMFASATIRRYGQIADAAQRAADGSKQAWANVETGLDDTSQILNVIPGQFAKVANEAVSAASDIMKAYEAGGGGVTGAINAAVAAVVDLGKALVGIGGPSQDELAARSSWGDFQKQFGSLQGTIAAVGAAYTELGISGTQAQADLQRALDATHISAAAEAAALKPIQDVLDQVKNLSTEASDSLSGFTAVAQGIAGPFNTAMAAVDAAKGSVQALAAAGTTSGSQWDQAQASLTKAMAALGGTTNVTADDLKNLGVEAVASFAAAVASGMSTKQALASIGPGLDTLVTAYQNLGISTDDVALKNLLMQEQIVKGNPSLMAAIDGVSQEMTALNGMGLMTVDTFHAMEGTGTKMYKDLQDQVKALGGGDKDALTQMQTFLHNAADEAQKLGIPLDDNTQSLIDQSKELGIWQDAGKTATDKLIDGMGTLVDKMNAVIDALSGKGGITDAINGIPRDVGINIHYNTPSLPSGYLPGDQYDPNAIPMADGGAGMVTGPTLFLAGEAGPEQVAFSGANKGFAGSVPGGTKTIDDLHDELSGLRNDFAWIQNALPIAIRDALQRA